MHFQTIALSFCVSLKGVGGCFCHLRYITANTDTEEQSFPVPQALNTHIEELKLDVLLQKVDHLRINESNKMESFELLCDHKEKVRAVWQRYVHTVFNFYSSTTLLILKLQYCAAVHRERIRMYFHKMSNCLKLNLS